MFSISSPMLNSISNNQTRRMFTTAVGAPHACIILLPSHHRDDGCHPIAAPCANAGHGNGYGYGGSRRWQWRWWQQRVEFTPPGTSRERRRRWMPHFNSRMDYAAVAVVGSDRWRSCPCQSATKRGVPGLKLRTIGYSLRYFHLLQLFCLFGPSSLRKGPDGLTRHNLLWTSVDRREYLVGPNTSPFSVS